MKKRDYSLAGQVALLLEPEEHVETFREYLTRRLLPYKAAVPPKVIAWNKANRGQGIFPGKNAEKREKRAAAKLDRLAAIRYYRRVLGSDHVPKLKKYPAVIFE